MSNNKKVIYTALSKHSYFANMHICAYVFENGAVPVNPFNLFGYFLFDMVDRDTVRAANSSVIERVDEVWTFGVVADGVAAEILLARALGKPVRYFTLSSRIDEIVEINRDMLIFEPSVPKSVVEKVLAV